MVSKRKVHRNPTRSARGELARSKLKDALITVLERVPYHRVRVTDVTGEAGVATGLFYHYFPDLPALITEVLEDFLARLESPEEIERGVARGDWFGRVLSHYRVVVQCYSDSPGLMRCITDVSTDDARFRELWRNSYLRQLQLLVDLMPRIFPGSGLSGGEAELVVRALGSVGQDILREYFIERRMDLRQLDLSDDALAEWLAAIFYRGLFARNPPISALRHAGKIVDLQRNGQDDQILSAGEEA